MRRRVFSWIFIWTCLRLGRSEQLASNFTPTNDQKDMRGLFSPRMDYDQWKPLGRGDPLKNDPTYDYVPPVLDRVHYWIDPALRKPDPPLPGENQKTEILLLGVSSKKPSTGTSIADSRKDTFDSFLKFVDGPKFTNQRNNRPHYPMGSSYFPPNFYPKNKNNLPKNPYTVLMPPPMITKKPALSSPNPTTTDPTTTPATTAAKTEQVTVQAANLVYHSSSVGDWKTETSTNLTPNPATNRLKPFRDEIVFQKPFQLPESYIQIQFAPSRHNQTLVAASSDHNINYVTPPPLVEEVMHKGQVSDDNLDISNTYVKIGKTEAALMGQPPPPPPMMVFSHVQHPLITQTPLTMQTIQSMQSMQPPPVTTSPVYTKSTNPILEALEKEEVTTERIETTTTVPTTTTTTSLTTDPLFKHYKQPTEPLRGPLYLIIQGHSKVKTYGPSKQFHGIRVQETNEISDDEVRDKRLLSKKEETANSREARSGKLQTLKHVIQTGLGAIDFSDVDRSDRVKETELHFGYEVGEGVTRETYHKGIVEEARKLHEEA
ncbi:mucin-2 [Tribolium castaneum]|uniref:mucin-2 n=1 Tax=Tribolium castaneum TaxID=7070 RepID=UPI0030FE7AB6